MEDGDVIIVDSSEKPTSKVEILRGIITEKLTTAVREILAAVETTIVGYDREVLLLKQELEGHKRHLDTTLQQPDVCPSTIELKDNGNNNEKPTLNQEDEGAVVGDIPASDSSSMPCPINTDDPKDDTINPVHRVKITKRKPHTNHPDSEQLDNASGQQGPVQKTARRCLQNPNESHFFDQLWPATPELSVNPDFEAFLSAHNQSSDDQPAPSEIEVTTPEPTDQQNDTSVASGSATPNAQVLECKVCGVEFNSKRVLVEHVRSYHLNNPEVPCGVCGHRLETSEELRGHLETHLKHWQCEKCGRYFSTSFSFQKHGLVCQSGPRAPADDTLLESSSHQMSEQQGDALDSKCPFCDKVLQGNELEQHIMIHTGEKPFICTECGNKFMSQLSLKKHMKIHLGVKPFCCTVCDYKSLRSDHLKLHMNTHTGYRPYKCSLCDKSFTQGNGLKAHMKTHMSKLKE